MPPRQLLLFHISTPWDGSGEREGKSQKTKGKVKVRDTWEVKSGRNCDESIQYGVSLSLLHLTGPTATNCFSLFHHNWCCLFLYLYLRYIVFFPSSVWANFSIYYISDQLNGSHVNDKNDVIFRNAKLRWKFSYILVLFVFIFCTRKFLWIGLTKSLFFLMKLI